MKKTLVMLTIVLALATLTVACAHKTCPAYRGSIAEATR